MQQGIFKVTHIGGGIKQCKSMGNFEGFPLWPLDTSRRNLLRQWVRCRWVEFGAHWLGETVTGDRGILCQYKSCLRSNPWWLFWPEILYRHLEVWTFFHPWSENFDFGLRRFYIEKTGVVWWFSAENKSWKLKDSHRVTEAMRWFPFLFMSLQQLFNVGGNLLRKCWGGKMGQLQPVNS